MARVPANVAADSDFYEPMPSRKDMKKQMAKKGMPPKKMPKPSRSASGGKGCK